MNASVVGPRPYFCVAETCVIILVRHDKHAAHSAFARSAAATRQMHAELTRRFSYKMSEGLTPDEAAGLLYVYHVPAPPITPYRRKKASASRLFTLDAVQTYEYEGAS